MKQRILVVEDEEAIALGLQLNLERAGFETELAGDGEHALALVETWEPDLVLLDVMLPKLSGFDVCDRVRRAGNRVPILFLTARDMLDDRVRGLELGGDDYITKPFSTDELIVRIRAMLRRQAWYEREPEQGTTVAFGGNRVDLAAYRAETPRGLFQLTQKETMVLKLLVENEGRVVDRGTVLNKVWGEEMYPTARTVDNIILGLRRRFEENPKQPRHILTHYGAGYSFQR
ncbi:MAG: Transcriptional regulatory protein WalR [Calditrichaeota bacterium]|nr:Transcriptional regulatory protein WalR [Calditrichota bacterium]